jgi:putative serine protease PepD
MVDEQHPGDGSAPSPYSGYSRDSDYFGPHSFAPPTYPPPTGYAGATPVWSAPATVPVRTASPAATRRRGVRPAALIAASAVTALVVGGAAGFGGARLAQETAPQVAPAASTTADPPLPDPTDPPGPSPSTAPTKVAPLPPAPAEVNTVAVAKRTLPSTVMIQVGGSTGSGFVLDVEGNIMTNNHVVAGAGDRKIRVVFAGGKRQTATLVGRSPSYDLAVIKVKASSDLKPMAIGNSDQTEVGQPVVAIGSPLGLPGTVTQGIVSAVNRPLVVGQSNDADNPTAYINGIQTDAPINPGNSGGPMVDAAARVIGVNSAILTMGASEGQTGNIGLGFAIPINQARVIGDQLISKGKATYPVIGATVETTDAGVEVTTIDSSGPAAKAGLREGDRITEIDGQVVNAKEELIVAIRTRRPGQVVVLDYTRGSASDQVKVTLGSRVG